MSPSLVIEKRKSSAPGNLVFSILIPSWNNLAYLQLCVDSIRKNSKYKHQIIVHVNEGKDGSLEWVKSQGDLDYTYSAENIGICYALNMSSELAVTNYIVYLNDDMYVCTDWDAGLYAEIKNINHDYFFFSSTAIEHQATGNQCVIVQDYGTDIASFQEKKLLNEFSSLAKEDWQGATWPPNIVHRDIWNLVGGYSTEFSPGMYSDPDFSMKLWLLGVRLFKGVSKSRVYHFGSKSTVRVTKNRGYFTFISKWGMTARTFTKNYLHSGSQYDGPLAIPVLPFSLRCKNFFKQLSVSFHRH
ncbi:MAG TPA: glycosyltransferase [Puia sp.]|nr:glycosyltransferase [Puia sp.]